MDTKEEKARKMIKRRNLKSGNQGITLITLVVTIIILIILATITVTILLNSGMIGLALKGKEKYEAEAQNELDFFNSIDNFLDLKNSDDLVLPDKVYSPEESTYKKMRKYGLLFTRHEWF